MVLLPPSEKDARRDGCGRWSTTAPASTWSSTPSSPQGLRDLPGFVLVSVGRRRDQGRHPRRGPGLVHHRRRDRRGRRHHTSPPGPSSPSPGSPRPGWPSGADGRGGRAAPDRERPGAGRRSREPPGAEAGAEPRPAPEPVPTPGARAGARARAGAGRAASGVDPDSEHGIRSPASRRRVRSGPNRSCRRSRPCRRSPASPSGPPPPIEHDGNDPGRPARRAIPAAVRRHPRTWPARRPAGVLQRRRRRRRPGGRWSAAHPRPGASPPATSRELVTVPSPAPGDLLDPPRDPARRRRRPRERRRHRPGLDQRHRPRPARPASRGPPARDRRPARPRRDHRPRRRRHDPGDQSLMSVPPSPGPSRRTRRPASTGGSTPSPSTG